MNKIMLTLAVAAVLVIAGCATTEVTEGPVAEERASEQTGDQAGKAETVETAEKAETVETTETVKKAETAETANTEPETTRIQKTFFTPYTVRETSFYSDGFIESYKVFTYDKNMNLVREDLFNSFDEIIESQVYKRLPDGTIERSLFDARGQLQATSRIINNGAYHPVKIEFLDSENELQTVSEFEYDSQGNKTDWTVYNGSGSGLSKTKYLYEGDLNIKIDIFDAAEELKEYFILEYKQEKLVNKSHFDEEDKIKSSINYTYDDAGNLVEEIFMRANGSVLRKIEYMNDERGNPVKIKYHDGSGELKNSVEREYEYKRDEIFVWE